jgi:hypothetical protein
VGDNRQGGITVIGLKRLRLVALLAPALTFLPGCPTAQGCRQNAPGCTEAKIFVDGYSGVVWGTG